MKDRNFIFRTLAASCLTAALCAGAYAQTTAPANPALSAAEKAAAEAADAPLAAAASDAPASPATEAPTTTSTTTTTTTVSDAKLDQFVDAYVAVQNLQKAAVDKPPTNTDPAKAQADAMDLQVKMKDAVEKSGLQVDEFNQIAQAMLTDLDLRAKVAEKVQARSKG